MMMQLHRKSCQSRSTCAGGSSCRMAAANPWLVPSRPMQHTRLQVICAASKSNLYEILGIPTSASDREIKSAYRKRALKLHPDVNKAPDAQERFMEAKMAFETLGDAKQRAEYDRRMRMGFGSSSDWQSRYSSSTGGGSSTSTGYGARRPTSQPEDNYTFDDLMRDLDKEFSNWSKSSSSGKGGKQPKSLIEELEMLGEELVDFLEDAIGAREARDSMSTQEDSKAGSSGASESTSSGKASSNSTSSEPRKPRSPIEEFDELWKKYGEPIAGSASTNSAGSTNGSTSSSSSSSSNSSSGASTGTARTGGSAPAGGRTAAASKSTDDDIDAMLAALKKKVRKES